MAGSLVCGTTPMFINKDVYHLNLEQAQTTQYTHDLTLKVCTVVFDLAA